MDQTKPIKKVKKTKMYTFFYIFNPNIILLQMQQYSTPMARCTSSRRVNITGINNISCTVHEYEVYFLVSDGFIIFIVYDEYGLILLQRFQVVKGSIFNKVFFRNHIRNTRYIIDSFSFFFVPLIKRMVPVL